ncbi:MAG: ABC transporter permease [Nitriliruptoraceae bacterium]
MRAALVILRKDLTLRLRDRSVLLFAVVVPLGLTVLFSAVFPDEDDLEISGAVVDQDGGEVAAGFVDGVLPALAEEGVVSLVEVADAAEASGRVGDGEFDVAWIVPEGFSRAVSTGVDARIEVIIAEEGSLEGEIARGVAQRFATGVEEVALAIAVATGGDTPPSPELIESIATGAQDGEDPITLDALEAGAEEQLDATSYLAAGMASFFVFFVVGSGVLARLEEDQLNTLPRLLAAPIPPSAVPIGKALGSLVVGSASMTVLVAASSLLLDAYWGPIGGVAILVISLVLTAMAIMALVGAFARTAEQASNFQAIVGIVLGMLGGAFFPLPGRGVVFTVLGWISPHRWFLDGIDGIVATGRATAALPAAAAILGLGALTALPAVWLQRRSTAW